MEPSARPFGALSFAEDGAECFPGAVQANLPDITRALAHLPSERAGVRLHRIAPLDAIIASTGPVGTIAAQILGPTCRAVRAILFDKTPTTNWSLAWHQDRTIVVQQRREVEGFGPWTTKGGLQHVAPPFSILADMVTLRVHLDAVDENNAPLLVAPGSHRCGRIRESDILMIVERCGTAVCLADAGDVWLYATPILHASEAAIQPCSRKVLQIDFAVTELPEGLCWLGV